MQQAKMLTLIENNNKEQVPCFLTTAQTAD